MSFLTRLSLRLGSVVLMAVALLFGAGVLAASQVPQDLLPNISLPAFVVVTPFPGASPTVVDQQVGLPVSNAVGGIPGVDTVTSTSSQSASVVIVQFKDGTDIKGAQQDISTTLTRLRPTLPQTAQSSTVQSFSTSQLPILQYAVSADESQGELAGQLQSVALPKLQGIAGVASISVSGAPTDEVQVSLDLTRLAGHGLTTAQVVSALQQATAVQSVGTLQKDGATIPLQVSNSLTSLDQVGSVLVTAGASGRPGAGAQAAAGQSVALSELGTVKLVSVPADTITRTDGKPSIGLQVLKTPDANTVTVANAVKPAMRDLRSQIGHGVTFQAVSDQAVPITQAIGDILREGLLGAAFAVLVILVFLRSGRATVVAAISIPLSLLVALLALWWQGLTLNILTLGGMMVAVGRVVDDAIVVLENISRHVGEGEGPLAAAYTASREIVTAVTASTLTTVAVFLPIVFMSGIAGSFFRPFALTVVVAMLASLAVAITVVPLLASRLLPAAPSPQPSGVATGGWLQSAYVPVIRWATAHRAIALVAAAAIFGASMTLLPLLKVNLLDQSASPNFPITLTMPANSTLTQTDAETESVERLVNGVAGISAYQATAGGSSDPFARAGTVPADPTQASILVLVQQGQYDRALNGVKSALKAYSGPAKANVGQARNNANASSSQLQLQVHATDPAALARASDQVLEALAGVTGVTEVKSDLAASKPQYQLLPTPALARSGLTVQQLAAIVAQQINGQVATRAVLPSGQVSVRVQVAGDGINTPSGLMSLQLPTANGVVPLSELAGLELVQGPQSVNRSGGIQTATITGTISSNNTRAVQNDVNGALGRLHLPTGASVSTGGVFAQLSTVLTQFVIALLAAIGLVYLIMVATFRSLLKPLVLLVSIPFAATGAIVALVVTQTSLSLPGLIGLLMLTGIVVTNAIVLLDLVEQYRDRGLPLQEALIEGGRRRLRPILMTALATMLALVPLAVSGPGTGGGFIGAPLAIVVIGGLFTSTILTLIIVPVLYSLVSRFTGARSQAALEETLAKADGRGVGSPA